MVTIPTTDRQFYDTQAKESGLATYSKALAPAVELLGKVFHEQEKLKMQALKQQASIDMATVTAEWRKQNALNPNDPEKLKELNAQYDDIIQQAKEQIDPYYRNEFEVLGTGVKNSFALKNSTWAVSQRGQNTKAYAGLIGDNTAKQVYELARKGDVDGAFASWEKGGEILLNQQGLDLVDSAKIIATMDNKVAQGIIYGLMEINPQMALDYINHEKIRRAIPPQQYHALMTLVEKNVFKDDTKKVFKNPTDENVDKWNKKYSNTASETQIKKVQNANVLHNDSMQIKSIDEARTELERFYLTNNVKTAVANEPLLEKEYEYDFFRQAVYLSKRIENSNLEKEAKDELQKSIYGMLFDQVYSNNIEGVLLANKKYLDVNKSIEEKNLNIISDNYLSDSRAPTDKEKKDYKVSSKNRDRMQDMGLSDEKSLMSRIRQQSDIAFYNAIKKANNGDWDGAISEIENGGLNIAQLMNPGVIVKNLKVGEEFLYKPTGQMLVFKGIQNGTVFVEIPKNSTSSK